MPPNTLVYECGHRVLETPSVLTKIKRTLSILRALSTMAREPKDIPTKGLCPNCQLQTAPDGPFQAASALEKGESSSGVSQGK